MGARTRAVVAALAALALAGGPLPAQGSPGADEGPAPRTIEEAVADDLGITMTEFVEAGAAAELAAPRLGLDGDRTAGTVGPPPLAVLTDDGVEILGSGAGEGAHGAFADLEELRGRYLADVGPDGLTGLAYTLDGYEVLVTDPDEARERGRTDPSSPVRSPRQWAAEHPRVTVVGTTGPRAGATLRGGAPISFGSSACTHGFNGYYNRAQVGLAAGHCAHGGGSAVWAGSTRVGTVTWFQFGAPGSALESYGTDLTTYSQGSAFTYPPSVTAGSSSVTITGRAPAVLGLPVCKMGRQTGWTCSTVNRIGWQWIGDGSGDISRPKRWVWSLFADLRVIPGDSGGPWVAGNKAVGVTSSYDWYADGRPYSTAALLTSLDDYRPGAQVKVWLGSPSVGGVEKVDATTALARWARGRVVSGTLSRPSGDSISPGTVMDVVVDGTRVASPSVAADGTFSFSYPGSDATAHTVTIQARQGDSRGSVLRVLDEPAGSAPKVVRHAGANRYATAATVARTFYAPGVDTVYVASGQDFADALSGGARAGSDGVPVVLTPATGLHTATRDALTHLAPRRIVVLGGTVAVSGAVERELRTYAPVVERVEGLDRYHVSAAVSRTYPAGQSTVFVVSGQAFPDALGASAQAGSLGVPLVLTRSTSLPAVVATELARLRPAEIVVVGGTVAVNGDVEAALRAYAPKVTRIAGRDRYIVSALLAQRYAVPAQEAWVARGTDFPDALAAAPVAAREGAPVVLTRPTGLPAVVGTALEQVRAPVVRIAGGTVSVDQVVERDLRWLTYPL
ncbi:cell wall-binding repeat-containing protein [Ornithinimicrobium cerasi]|uniref:Cell wall binding repeat 2 n=1 Tax=Ornithinimicrobium cerasi TaxID=2248773 RepID=A0A285VS74_9MICO|nr:cell wall-binding repeat-containing protein [Ornithinimicrobium cerasi]SOC56727.1 Putative cell wall binding repeat 2 [Ornithinimicrobium cerasi]